MTDERDVLAGRVLGHLNAALDSFAIYLGVELGLYEAMKDRPVTEAELAARAGIAPRYAREWLEQQTVSGWVAVDDPDLPAPERRYELPAAQAELFTDAGSPWYVAGGGRMLAGVALALPALLDAYRGGGGVSYAAFGPGIRDGIASFNRPMFRNDLAGWLAAVPGLDDRLRAAPPARVLDLGAGAGESSVAIATAYPLARVNGIDLDPASVEQARAAAAEAGVAGRVTFTLGDAAAVADQGPFDLVTIFEALHDMGDPVGALRSARAVLAEGGSVLIGDEQVADTFPGTSADLDGFDLERFNYGWSVLHCLPATMAEHPVEANGTVLRAPTVARWAAEAGFAHFEVVGVEHDFWRFYALGH
jgi:SAM-dependent methyltransferase